VGPQSLDIMVVTILGPNGTRKPTPGSPARSQVLYRLSHSGFEVALVPTRCQVG
jgi:hypothetical protein